MTKNKVTKRSLLSSGLALLLCISMLVGSTFAWFTDSVESGINKIVAGNLDVELEYKKVVDGTATEWADVKDATEIFNPNALWEPGHVEVVYLKVSNLGTLELKYQLGVNISKETPGKTEAGDDIYLSKHLVFKTVEMPDALTTYTDRQAAQLAAGTEKGLKDYNGKTTSLEVNGEDYVALIVYMPESVGNEANYRGDAVPTIELGVNLYATQYTAEFDSFGPDYDKDAWNDSMTVYDAADLNAAIANGGKVMLGADITSDNGFAITKNTALNLNGHTLTATGEGAYLFNVSGDADLTIVGGELVARSTNGKVDGTGTSTGAYGVVNFESTGTLTMTDVQVQGSVYGGKRAVQVFNGDATLTNVDITTAYGSGVNAGSGASVVLNDCDITVNGMYSAPYNSVCFSVMGGASLTVNSGNYVMNNTDVYPTGNTHGGWIGIVMNSGGTMTINGGTYTNVPIAGFVASAEREILHAQAGANAPATLVLNGGTFDPQATKVYGLKDGATLEMNGNEIVDNGDGTYTVVLSGMSVVTGYPGLYTNGTDFYVYNVTGLMSLNSYFADNRMNNSVWTRNYNIMANINAAGCTWNNVYMVTGTDAAEGINLLGNGHTISNLTIAGGGMLGGTPNCTNSENPAYVKNLTFDNVTVTGNAHFAGIVWGGAATCGDVYFEDVHVVNSSVTGNCNVGALIGATGEQSASYDLTITFKDCSVENTTLVAAGNPGADPTGASAFIGRAYANTSLVFEGENIAKGNTITNNNGLVGGGIYGYTIWTSNGFAGTGKCDAFTNWNGISAVAENTNAALAEAINSGASKVVMPAGTYKMPAAVKGKTVTVSGTKDTVIDVSGGLTDINGSTVTFDGVTIKSTPGTGYNYGFNDAKYTVFNNCTIEGTLGLDYSCEFNNCVFNISGNNYNIWTWGAGTATFNGCTFNCDGKAMLVYANVLDNNSYHQTVNITDCVFNDNGDDSVTGKAAIEITNTYTPVRTYDVIIKNTTVNGFAQTVPGADDFNAAYGSVEGSDIGTNVWGNKCKLPNTQINVEIDGVDVY